MVVFEVSATDHEDQGLAAFFREFGEIVVEVAAELEVDVELETRSCVPIISGVGNPVWKDRGAIAQVYFQQFIEDGCYSPAADSQGLRIYARVVPTEETVIVRFLAVRDADVPELS